MILLDTHSLIWALEDSPKLGPRARDLIASSTHRYISAVSHAEITIKTMLGKLRPFDDLRSRAEQDGFEPLALHDRHTQGLRAFEALIRHDPFDRLLIAQARVDGLVLITADEVLLQYAGTADATR